MTPQQGVGGQRKKAVLPSERWYPESHHQPSPTHAWTRLQEMSPPNTRESGTLTRSSQGPGAQMDLSSKQLSGPQEQVASHIIPTVSTQKTWEEDKRTAQTAHSSLHTWDRFPKSTAVRRQCLLIVTLLQNLKKKKKERQSQVSLAHPILVLHSPTPPQYWRLIPGLAHTKQTLPCSYTQSFSFLF